MQKMTSKYLPSLDLQTFNYVEDSDFFRKRLSNSFKTQVEYISINVRKAKLHFHLEHEKHPWEQPTFFSRSQSKILAYCGLRYL